jgi:Fur family transcriptional regulator, ferric uptake regulator
VERKTAQRYAIERIFREAEQPLTVDEILRSGQRYVPSLDRATVYRNLKLMVSKGQIRRVSHPCVGALFEPTNRAHHHHFHCRLCNHVFELPGCTLDEKLAVPEGFIAEQHEVFLFGICSSCQM